ncbi:MAG: hypothetical protein QOK11_3457, partial [Pseudonocardiales bacterium]|nr:hypothetical protein [Pseudonocardiales bacterium]
VQNWTRGKITPGTPELRAWAMITGVSFEWLRDGLVPVDLLEEYGTGLTPAPASRASVRRQGLEPRTR